MKIYIIGCSCSGKTTLAGKLAEKYNIRHIELDQLWWLPGWKERDPDEFKELVQNTLQQHDNWVVDGNYSRVRELFLPHADQIIWLNLPFYKVFWRCLTRSSRRILKGETVCNGNKEDWRALLSWDGMPAWIIRSYKIRHNYGYNLKQNDNRVVELKTQKDIDDFVNS